MKKRKSNHWSDDDSDVESEVEAPKKKKKKTKKKKDKGTSTVFNEDIIQQCKLRPDERFGSVFHPKNKKAFTGTIPMLNDEEICHRFHSTGYCSKTCKFSKSHVPLPSPVDNQWITFSSFCRECHSKGKEEN